MNALADAAIGLLKRERAVIVAATGLIFDALASRCRAAALEEVLESWRGGAWGKETPPGVGFPVLRSTNMRGKRVDPTDPAWVDVQPKLAAACALQPGDILVTKSSGSEDLVGKAALFVGADDEFPYLFSNFTLRLRPNGAKVRPEYLAWFLRSPQALMWRYASQETAVGLRNLQVGEYLRQDIPLPPVDYQTSVVAFLDDVESKVSATDARIPDDLCEQRRIVARIEELAGRVAEVSGLQRQAAEDTQQLHSSAKRVAFEDAKRFGERPMDECYARIPNGRRYDKATVSETGKVPVLSQSEDSLLGYHDGVPGVGEDQIPLVTFANHTCAVRFVDFPFSTIQNVFLLKPEPELDPRYFYHFLHGRVPQEFYGGHWSEVGLLRVPVPPLSEQRRIVAELDALQTKVDELKRLQAETQAELDALLPSILDRAFKGAL
jgi:type I restriction enzyme, S subunit